MTLAQTLFPPLSFFEHPDATSNVSNARVLRLRATAIALYQHSENPRSKTRERDTKLPKERGRVTSAG